MKSIFDLDILDNYWKSKDFPFIQSMERILSWSEFMVSVKSLSSYINSYSDGSWILYTEEPEFFLIGFFALMFSGKDIVLPGVAPDTGELKRPFLSDDFIKRHNDSDDNCFKKSFDPSSQTVTLQTSGSTGESKNIVKTYRQIESELLELKDLWGDDFSDSIVYSTVSHQHYYGLLFSILLPVISGTTIVGRRIHYPESIYSFPDRKVVLTSSPAFLKRLTSLCKTSFTKTAELTIFSSGGFLPSMTSEYCRELLKTDIKEIYGSTETGGIGWKQSPGQNRWTPFRCIEISEDNSNGTFIRSPFLDSDDKYILDDSIEIYGNGQFTLIGRLDSIVKVEEKRVALNDIENRLLETGYAADVTVLFMEGKRQFIAAAIELNHLGKVKFEGFKKLEINNYFRNCLKTFFHPTVLPKKWRYPESIPRNTQGKLLRDKALSLFLCKTDVNSPIIHSELIDGDEMLYTIEHSENYRYFNGHFPEIKLLPAVAQVDWVLNTFSKVHNVDISVDVIPRLKFKNPIFPNKKVSVKISYDKKSKVVIFKYFDHKSNKIYSNGKILLKGSYENK